MKKTGGPRRKTRHIFRKHDHEKGKVSLTHYFQSFDKGDHVALSLEAGVQKAMYHPMFYGKIGVVLAKRGRCYEVQIWDKSKQKTLLAHPVHLRRV